MNLTEGDVFALLTDIRRGLDTDGYDLEIDEAADLIRLRIVARPDACDDCLVGKQIMREIVASALREMDDAVTADQIEVAYPADAHA